MQMITAANCAPLASATATEGGFHLENKRHLTPESGSFSLVGEPRMGGI